MPRTFAIVVSLTMMASPAIAQRAAVPTAVAKFDAMPAWLMGYMMVLKFRPTMLNNDEAARYAALALDSTDTSCRAAAPYSNEFDRASATISARARVLKFLNAIPARINTHLRVDLGSYDRTVGGFPIGSWTGDNHLHPVVARIGALGAYGKPPTNIGNNYRSCGLDPYPNQRLQVRAVDPAINWFGYLIMPETAARVYAATHTKEMRKIDIDLTQTISAIEDETNGWRGFSSNSPPALIFNLMGHKEVLLIRDWITHQPIAGKVIFRDSSPEIIE